MLARKNICDSCARKCNTFDRARGMACKDYQSKEIYSSKRREHHVETETENRTLGLRADIR